MLKAILVITLVILMPTQSRITLANSPDECKPPVDCKKGEFCPEDCGGPDAELGTGTRFY